MMLRTNKNTVTLRARRRRIRQSHAAVECLEARALLTTTGDIAALLALETPSLDGTGNNLENPELGSTNTELLRLLNAEYGDGVSSPAGDDRPSAREVSNAVASQTSSVTNARSLTDMLWLWGQFIDHDIDLTEAADPAESFPIEVPAGDFHFDPTGTGTATIGLNRSTWVTDPLTGQREQINQITAFLDGSVIYGSDTHRSDALREFTGGRLLVSDGDLLPFNEQGLENAGGPSASLFLAGDVRANENVALSAMHTIWVREHNRTADEIAAENPDLSDEEIFQAARSLVTARLQVITYNEFLPALLGPDAIEDYEGYDATVNPSIANAFSTAAYRLGHSLLSSNLLRLDADGNTAAEGDLSLQSAFFSPSELIDHGIDSILRGASVQVSQELDNLVIDDVRNFLFGPPGAGGFDLASLNIQRGRDHGLPDYNQARADLGLGRVTSFSEITSNPEAAAALESVYGDVNNIDLWVGGLAEDHLPGSSVGELFSTILSDQFERLRDGDRFWYENVFSGRQLEEIEQTTLAEVIERNSDIEGLQPAVFFAPTVMMMDLGQSEAANVTVRRRAGQIEVINDRTRDVMFARPVDEVDQLMLMGSAATTERITVLAGVGEEYLPGGIMLATGGNRDVLRIRGTNQADVVEADATGVTVNGMVIEHTGMGTLHVRARRGDDLVDISDAGGLRLRAYGDAGDDQLIGGEKSDRLYGGAGNDMLFGLGGDDLLFGGSGDDTLEGGAGDDRLQSGRGRRTARGGEGRDRVDGRLEPRDSERRSPAAQLFANLSARLDELFTN